MIGARREFRVSAYHFPDEMSKIDHGAAALTGIHKTRWNNYEEEHDAQAEGMTFEEFGKFLININSDEESRSLASATKYFAAKQTEKQTPAEFHTYLTSLENLLPKQDEEWLSLNFLMRLRPDLQEKVRLSGDNVDMRTREQWVEHAVRMDGITKGPAAVTAALGANSGGGSSNVNSSRKSKGKGDKRKREGERPAYTPSHKSAGKPNDSTTNSYKATVLCYNCGKMGHYSKECRSAANPDLVAKEKAKLAPRTAAIHKESSKNESPGAKKSRHSKGDRK